MSTPSQIGTAVLTAIFVVVVAGLLASLYFTIWIRRRFCQRSPASACSELGGDPSFSPSKELILFFTLNNHQPCVKPPSAPPLSDTGVGAATAPIDEALKWKDLYGASRLLYTTKETTQKLAKVEEGKAEPDNRRASAAEKGSKTSKVSPEAAMVPEVVVGDDSTPFSTPCGSPPYYTPPPSPKRDDSACAVLRDEAETAELRVCSDILHGGGG